MVKNRFLLVGLLVFIVMLTSCELQKTPPSTLDAAVVVKNDESPPSATQTACSPCEQRCRYELEAWLDWDGDGQHDTQACALANFEFNVALDANRQPESYCGPLTGQGVTGPDGKVEIVLDGACDCVAEIFPQIGAQWRLTASQGSSYDFATVNLDDPALRELCPAKAAGWLDRIVFVTEPSARNAIVRLAAGDIDLYAGQASTVETYKAAQEAGLNLGAFFGTYNDIFFNLAGPVFPKSGQLNPFAVREIREAMNWLIDREHIIQEVYGGMGVAKYLPISSAFPEYGRNVVTVRKLEAYYAYDPTKAESIIQNEMEKLGAVKNAQGFWTYRGEPLSLVFLIRSEDVRRQIGDYVANQLESIGFSVDRQYKTVSEVWAVMSGENGEEKWHMYTEGWSNFGVMRDEAMTISFFHLPGDSEWVQNYGLSDAQVQAMERLDRGDFTSLTEREELFAQALEAGLQTANRVWLVDGRGFIPYRSNVAVSVDLGSGVLLSSLQGMTLGFTDRVGGELTYALPNLFEGTTNPVEGTGSTSMKAAQYYLQGYPVLLDPYTGLWQANWIERADVVVLEGLPVQKSLDWVNLEFAPRIEVPPDAWVDWNADEQRWITAGEKYPDGLTARVKSTVYYPVDFFGKVKWHDGSPISLADYVQAMIVRFDASSEGSAIYNPELVAEREAYMSYFRGLRFVSRQPLVIETYSDQYTLDAENNVEVIWPDSSLMGFGFAPWHSVAVAFLAEANGEVAFTSGKAAEELLDVVNFVSGPTLEILGARLDDAQRTGFVPYPQVMSEFLNEDEVTQRYKNLTAWFEQQGHFLLGTGPYYLDQVFPTEQQMTMERFSGYPDPSEKWVQYRRPAIPEVMVDGPVQVEGGIQAVYDIYISYSGAPYDLEDLESVRYLVFDLDGNLRVNEQAQTVADGHYLAPLSTDFIAGLEAGPYRLEVVVISRRVALTVISEYEFYRANR